MSADPDPALLAAALVFAAQPLRAARWRSATSFPASPAVSASP